MPIALLALVLASLGTASAENDSETKPFRILGPPEWVAGEGWRISFQSVPGRLYALQRSTDLTLWQTVTSLDKIAAASDTTAVIDPIGQEESSLFWRVQRLGDNEVTPFAEAFRVTAMDLIQDGEVWRITWNSREGKLYLLQRSFNLIDWENVVTVLASGPSTFADDAAVAGEPRVFWRVRLLDDDGIGGTPIVDNLEAYLVQTDNGLVVELRAATRDNVEVVRAVFHEGPAAGELDLLLGEAASDGPGNWVIETDAPEDAFAVRYYRARAFDAADNVGELIRGFSLFDTRLYAPIGPDGEARRGAVVAIRDDGTLGPFEYRPGGGGPMGGGGEIAFRFSEGAQLVDDAKGLRFRFPQAVAQFGSTAPFRFAEAMVLDGNLFDLPAAGISVDDLILLGGLPPEEGIRLRLFDHFDLVWLSGRLTPNGIEDGIFALHAENLPLPGPSAAYADFTIDLSEPGVLRLPFHGTFALSDGTANPVSLVISPERPLWLELRADGSVSLEGTGKVILPGGGGFRAAVRMTDPIYELHVSVDSVEIPLLGSLADALPNSVHVCLDHTDTSLAIQCLRHHARAYGSFSASAGATVPADATGATPPAPPRAIDTLGALADAWAASVSAGLSGAAPVQASRDFLRSFGGSAAATRDLASVVAYYAALERARAAVVEAGAGDISGVLPELETALDEARSAAVLRASEADAIKNLDTLRETLRLLLEAAANRQLAGLDDALDPAIEAALTEVMRRFFYEHLGALGVESGVFSPSGNPRIATMNRFTALRNLRDLVETVGTAMLLGFEPESGSFSFFNAPVDEALAQFAIRAAQRADEDLSTAHSSRDYLGYLLALADKIDLIALRQLGLLPNHQAVAVAIPESVDLASFEAELEQLAAVHDALPRVAGWSAPLGTELETLLRILNEAPDALDFPASPLKRAAARVEATLAELFAAGLDDVPVSLLLTILEAGSHHADLLRRIPDLGDPAGWEDNRLPEVIAELNLKGFAHKDWTGLERATRLLLNASQAPGIPSDAVQRIYLSHAADVLATARAVAVAVWNDAEARRDPLLDGIDMLLPGDLELSDVAGMLRYHRLDRELSGAVRGQLQLPGFLGGLRLTVARAAFSSGGEFELIAHGAVALPGSPPLLTLTVEPTAPAVFRFRPGNPLELSGTAEFLLANGMAFAGTAELRDPIYRFRLEARDLIFDTGVQVLNTFWPASPDFSAFDGDGLERWTELLSGVFGLGADAGLVQPGSDFQLLGQTPEVRSMPVNRISGPRLWQRLYEEAVAAGDTEARAILVDRYLELLEYTVGALADTVSALTATGASSTSMGSAEATLSAMSTQVEPGRLINFDFSPGPDTAFDQEKARFETGFGPAHNSADSLDLLTTQRHWNIVTGSAISDLIFADGTPAISVSIDLGHSPLLWDEVDWNLEPGFILRDPAITDTDLLPAFPLGSLLDPRLIANFASGRNFHDGRILSGRVGARVDGLPAGYYRVFALAAEPELSVQAWIGVTAGEVHRQAPPTGLLAPVLESAHLQQWSRERTYLFKDIILEEGQSVWVVTDRRSPEDPFNLRAARHGALAGLQIVSVARELVVARFAATPGSIEVGQTSVLSWSAPGAKTGAIDSVAVPAPSGTLDVSPPVTTTYQLTVADGFQTGSASVTVSVSAATTQEVRRRIYDELKDLEDLTLTPIPGEILMDPAKVEKAIGRFDDAATKIEDLLRHPAVIDDPDTFRAVIRAGLRVSRSGVTLGADEGSPSFELPTKLGPAGDDFTVRQDEKQGLNPETGEPNEEFIFDRITAEESYRILRENFKMHAESGHLGGERNISVPLLEVHAENVFRKLLAPYGYRPEQPWLSQALLEAAGERELAKTAAMLARIGVEIGNITNEFSLPTLPLKQLGDGLNDAITASREDGRHVTWREKLAAIRAMQAATTLLILADSASGSLVDFGANVFLREYALGTLRQVALAAPLSQRPLEDEIEVLERTIGFVVKGLDNQPDTEAAVFLHRRLGSFLRGLQTAFGNDPAWVTENIDMWLDQLAGLQQLIGRYETIVPPAAPLGDAPRPADLLFTLMNVVRLHIDTIEDEKRRHIVRANMSGKLLDAARKLGANLENPPLPPGAGTSDAIAEFDPVADALVDALRAEAGVLLAEAYAGATELRSALINLTEQDRPAGLSFSLGELRVSRVFGDMVFNRLTGDFRGSFGGTLAFPNLGAEFTLSEASLQSDGAFSLQGQSRFPLGGPGLAIESSLSAQGTTEGAFSATGAATVTLGEGPLAGDYGAVLSYDDATRKMKFTAATEGVSFGFGDDAVFFPSSLTVSIDGSTMAAGEIEISGSAGFLARSGAGAAAQPEDFLLYVENLTGKIVLSEEGFALSLEEGLLRLPESFGAGNCVGGGSPSVTLSPSAPLVVSWDATSGEIALGGQLAFSNILLAAPEFEGAGGEPLLTLEMCAATLTFPGSGALPVFALTSDQPGVLTAQLPSGPLTLNIVDLLWPLDGLPEATIVLPGNTVLIEEEGVFELSLLGAGTDGCASAALSFGTLGGETYLALSGGMAFQFAADVLAADNSPPGNPEPVSLRGCGSFGWIAGQPPSFTLDQLTTAGEVILGGSGGVRLGVEKFTVENPSSLFDPDAVDPFALSVENAVMRFDNGAFFAVTSGSFSTTGAFSLAVTAAGGAEGFGLSLSANAQRTAEGAFSFGGSGQMSAPDDGFTIAVNLVYSHDPATGQSLAFTGAAERIVLADDVVVFEGGFTFSVSGMDGESLIGAASVGGETGITVGLFREAGSAGTPVDGLTPDDFLLAVTEAKLDFLFEVEFFKVALSGQLTLPESIFNPAGSCGEQTGAPSVTIPENAPLFIAYNEGIASFGGAFLFENFCFALPDFPDFFVFVDTATLSFSSEALPALTGVNAIVSLPLPVLGSEDADPVLFGVADAQWALDGYPTGTLLLLSPATLFSIPMGESMGSNFVFTLLPAGLDCAGGSELALDLVDGRPRLTLGASMRVSLPLDFLAPEDGGTAGLRGKACGGSVTILAPQNFGDAPEIGFSLPDLTFATEGTWILGGADGFRLSDAFISLQNLDALIHGGTGENAFTLRFGGDLFVEPLGVGVAMQNAGFRFETGRALPIFLIPSEGSISVDANLLDNIPVTLTEAGFRVKNYLPGMEVSLQDLFDPTNVEINLSGEAFLPSRETPIISGRVDNLTVGLDFDTDLQVWLPELKVDGLGLGIDGTDLGPLQLKGQIYVGNISDPPNLFFAGEVGGVLNGTGVEVLLAINLRGLIGACISVQGGAAGIPIGPTGFLVTGATGGVSFASVFGDPCEFSNYIQIPPSGPPTFTDGSNPVAAGSIEDPSLVVPETAMDWNEWAEFNQQASTDGSQVLNTGHTVLCGNSGSPICTLADCPPGTVNILCQPHPDQSTYPGRIIFKFSALPRERLTEAIIAYDFIVNGGMTDLFEVFGLIQSMLPAEKEIHALAVLSNWTGAEQIAGNLAEGAFYLVDFLTPPLPAGLVGEPWDSIRVTMEEGLLDFRLTIEQMLVAALTGNVPASAEELLDGLALILGKGVPCIDMTVSLAGNLSYAGVSTVLNVEGGVTLSTTGTAGVAGRINLLGMPVGTVEAYISATDDQGLPNPSLCGFANIELGPLFLGRLDAQLACDDCVTGSVNVTYNFLVGLGDIFLSTLLTEVIDRDRFDPEVNDPVNDFLAPNLALLLDPEAPEPERNQAAQEFQALVGYLLTNIPPVGESFYDALLNYVIDLYGVINPVMQVCGEAHPKLFGFSLTGGNRPGAVEFRVEKNAIRGNLIFSPSLVIGNAFFCLGSFGVLCNTPIVPALDEAALGFGAGFEDLSRESLEKAINDPLGYVQDQVGYFLRHAVMTFGYQFSPFGFDLGGGSARMIMPNFDFHPTRPTVSWEPPGLINRQDLLIRGAERGVLCDALWMGDGPELADLFPEQSPDFQLAMAELDLSKDFFPHGGFLGGAYVDFPKVISAAPPYADFQALFHAEEDGIAGITKRIDAAMRIVNEWLLASERMGELSVYLPLPNPPALIWDLEQGPQAFLDSLLAVSYEDMVNAPADIYPLDQAFMRGKLRGAILGVPFLEAEIIAEPAEGLFRVAAQIPADEPTWLNEIATGGMVFEIKTASYIAAMDMAEAQSPEALTPAERFAEAFDILGDNSLTEEERVEVLYQKITDTLPKVSLAAELNLQIPDGMEEFFEVISGGIGAGFYGFSPNYNPDYPSNVDPSEIRFLDPNPANPGPYTLAVRRGGLVAGGHFRFGYFPSENEDDNLVINVPEATLAVTGPSDSLPLGLAGRLIADDVRLPAWTNPFDGEATPFAFRDGLLFFNSNPDPGADFIRVEGEIRSFDLDPFLRITSLDGGDEWLGAEIFVRRSEQDGLPVPGVGLRIQPAQAHLPLLGENFRAMIYGEHDPDAGTFSPFTFSSVPGQHWEATMRVEGMIELRSPFDLEGPVLLQAFPEVEDPLNPGEFLPAAFQVSLEGKGTGFFEMRVEIPNGMSFTAFPGQATESTFTAGSATATCIVINSYGQIYFDSGTRTVQLAGGAIEVEGRLEFGFEPFSLLPELDAFPTNLNFGSVTAQSVSSTQTVIVENRGTGRLVVDVDVTADNAHFTAQPNRLTLGPLESGSIVARYTPQSVATHTGTLALTSDFGNQLIPLTGIGTGSSLWHANPTSIAFGSVRLGHPKTRPILVTNPGNATLVISSTSVTGPYVIQPTSASIPPGEAREFKVTFNPPATGTQNGSVTFVTNTSTANRTVNFSGSGAAVVWHGQRLGGPDLRGGHQIIADAGWAVGEEGTILRTVNGGNIWEQVPSGQRNWSDIVFAWVAANASSVPSNLRGLIVAEDGHIAATADAGVTWQPYLLNNTALPSGVSWRAAGRRSSNQMVVAGERNGNAFIATEQTVGQWTLVEVPGAGPINDVAFFSERFPDTEPVRIGIAVGDNRTILRSNDGGQTWLPVSLRTELPADTRFVSASASQQNTLSDRHFLVVGQPDILMISPDGLEWDLKGPPSGLRGAYTAGAWTGNTVGQIVTSEGQIWRIQNRGDTFTEQFAQSVSPLRKVLHNRQTSETGGDSNFIWAVGDRGSIMRRPIATSGTILSLSVEPLAFGAVPWLEPAYRTVVVTNGGLAPVAVEGMQTSGGSGFTVYPEVQTIPPGESAAFTIRFAPESSNPVSATFTFGSGASSQQVTATAAAASARWTRRFSPTNADLVAGAVISGSTHVIAAERSIWQTTNGGATWSARVSNTAGPLRQVSFADSTHGFAVGGAGGTGTPTNFKSTIYHTTNSGTSWALVNSPVPTAFADVFYYRDFNTTDRQAFGISENFGSEEGRVLFTTQNTTTWNIVNLFNLQRVDGRAIAQGQGNTLWAAVANALHILPRDTGVWNKLIDATGKGEFQRIFFLPGSNDANAWVIGGDGNFWFTQTGGETTASWVNRSNASLGDIWDVRFVTQNRGWILSETEFDSRIYGTEDNGSTWQLEHIEPKTPAYPVLRAFMGTAADQLYAVGTNGGLWKFTPAGPVGPGYLHLPVTIDLGTIGVGDVTRDHLSAVNLGFSPVTVFGASMESDSSPSPFHADPVARAVEAGGQGIVAEFSFRPTAVGEFRALLHIASDAFNGSATIEVVGRAVPRASTVIVDSIPTGAPITVDSSTLSAARTFTVVDGSSSNANWQRGATRTVFAPLTLLRSGVNYAFSHWSEGGAGNTIAVTESGGIQRYTAVYVQTLPTPAAPPPPVQFAPSFCSEAGPPNDVPHGPWLKLSEAVVRFPTLDNGHTAAVEGAFFVSLTEANGVLKTSAFRLTSEPPPDGFDLVAVTAGSWRFDLVGTDFRFVGNNPGLRLFDRPVTPPSTFAFRASWDPEIPFAPPFVAGEFSTLGTLPLLPAVAELGPSTVDFAVSPTVKLNMAGTINLLKRPHTSGFFYPDRPFSFELGTATPVPGSGDTTTLVDFGFASLEGDAQTALVLQQDAAGVFTVRANDLILDGWGVGASRVGTIFASDGGASFNLDPPDGGLHLGALRFEPQSFNNRLSTLAFNLIRGEFSVAVPPSFIRPPIAGFWPNEQFPVDGFTIDTTDDFEIRAALPANIGGIATQPGALEKNYILFERKNQKVGFRARNEQELIFGEMTLRFNAIGTDVKGSLAGAARMPGLVPSIGSVPLGSAALDYDSTIGGYPFQGRFAFPNGAFRLQFGSSGSRICILNCHDSDLNDCSIGICIPP